MSGQRQKGVYSAPTRPREEHVRFSGPTGYVGPIPTGSSMDGDALTMRTGVDAPLAIERLSRDVYQNASSAPREDMANEMRSAAVAASMHGADPRIRVVADAKSRLFSVHGIDTMGCTWDAFSKALAVIGRTTNAEPGMPGQMGMGFYSNLLLSDTIIFESHSRETGERFTAMCKGGTEWQLGLVSAPMPEYGARVSMTVHGGVDMGKIRNMVRECARLSPCPVYLMDERGEWEALPMFSSAKSLCRWSMYNDMRRHDVVYYGDGDGRIDRNNSVPLPAAFVSAMRSAGMDGVVYLHGERDGVEVCAAFVAKIRRERVDEKTVRVRAIGESHRGVDAYLVGMPIRLAYRSALGGEDDVGFQLASQITVVVHDERKYRPTADRERFDSDAEDRICAKIDEILAERLAAVRWPRTLAEHLRGPYRAALDAAVDSGPRMGTTSDVIAVPPVGPEAAEAARIGRTPVRNGFDRKAMPLYHAALAHPRAVLAKSVDARLILAVARHDPSMRVIVTGKADELAGSGIEQIKPYMERVGIRPLDGAEFDAYARSAEWDAVRASYGQYEANDDRVRAVGEQVAYSVCGSQLEGNASLTRARGRIRAGKYDRIVAAGTHIGAIVGAMLVSDTSFAVARLAGRSGGSGRTRRPAFPLTTDPPAPPEVPDGTDVIAEADLLEAASRAEYHTSSGTMTGDEIVHHAGRIAILQCSDGLARRLAAAVAGSAWFGRPGTLYVACGGDSHFMLVSLLGSRGVGCSGGSGSSSKAGYPLSADRIFRVVALRKIPACEDRKTLVPAGTAITLADEIGGGCDPVRAGIVSDAHCNWTTRMDLLLAALEIKGMPVLAAFANAAGNMSSWRGFRMLDLIDDALDADGALCASGAGENESEAAGREPRTGYVADFPYDAVDASGSLLAQAKRWITGRAASVGVDALRRTTAAEVGSHAMGKRYHTNSGTLSLKEILAAAKSGASAAAWHQRRVAADIVVYDRDAQGLAEAMTAAGSGSGKTVVVVETVDDAVELACAVASRGFKCRVVGENSGRDLGWIMDGATDGAGLHSLKAVECARSSWREYPSAWHGMLAVRNRALKSLLVAALDKYNMGSDDTQVIGALVERFLWLDGRGKRKRTDTDGGGIAASAPAPASAEAAARSAAAEGDGDAAGSTAAVPRNDEEYVTAASEPGSGSATKR